MKHWYPSNVREQAEKLESNGELRFIKFQITGYTINFRECDLNIAQGVGPYPHLTQLTLSLMLCHYHGAFVTFITLDDIVEIQETMVAIKAKDTSSLKDNIIWLAYQKDKVFSIAVEI